MSDNFIGEIRTFSFPWAPRGWAACDGSSLSVNQNAALYALLGNQFGGDQKNFNLPDLRGRTPVHAGGLIANGLRSGSETFALTAANMPAHNHALVGSTGPGTTLNATGKVLGVAQPDQKQHTRQVIYGDGAPRTPMMADSVIATGGNAAHANLQPLQAINFCIALTGVFPMRP